MINTITATCASNCASEFPKNLEIAEGQVDSLALASRVTSAVWCNTPFTSEDGRPSDAWDFARGPTEQCRMCEQMQESQQLETACQLASGIAHDVNNLLTAISVCSHLLSTSFGPNDSAQQLLQEIKRATDRSASLTRHIIAFRSAQVFAPQVVCLNEVIRSLELSLKFMLGDGIQLITMLEERLDYVSVDPEQLERVLLNLVLNARNAMPGGGTLTVETSNAVVELGHDRCKQHWGVPTGRYVVLTVMDSGIGMSPERKRQVSDASISVRESECGSGMGLAAVHGIVRQSKAYMTVESEPGRGASFSIYFARVEERQEEGA